MKDTISQRLLKGSLTLPEYNKKIATLRGLSAELGLPVMPDLHIGVQVKDPGGQVVLQRTEQGHSWTRNAWVLFNLQMMDSPSNAAASTALNGTFRRGFQTLRQTNGTLLASTTAPPVLRSATYGGNGLQAAISAATSGIQVGTSAEPFHGEDFVLFGAIAEGAGAGQLSYQAQPTPTSSWDDGDATFTTTYSRTYNNNSTAAIVVNEVALTSNMSGTNVLLSRDILASPVNVPVGGQLTITVSIKTTSFAAIEALAPPYPAAAGATYGGGIFIGWVSGWSGSTTNGGLSNGHTKYALILAPKTGGEQATRQFYNSGSFTINPNDQAYGKSNSDALVAAGAASSLGQFCTSANAASLGGFTDWYIPSRAELLAVQARYAAIPGAEQPASANYWSSSWTAATSAVAINPVTGVEAASTALSSSLTARLVRRVKF
jgi:hypothetical protein